MGVLGPISNTSVFQNLVVRNYSSSTFFYQLCIPYDIINIDQHISIEHITYVTLDHKTSVKSLGYICSNSQKYTVWVKIIDFSFMPKIS